MNEFFLPIGSIVKISNDNKEIMIIGYFPNTVDKNIIKIYDYIGCYFPIGSKNKKFLYFSKNSIEFVSFIGYQNNNFRLYSEILNKTKEKLKIKSQNTNIKQL